MASIQVKNICKTDSEHVYQGPAALEVRSDGEGQDNAVQLWASDPAHAHAALGMFLSVEEARRLAKELLHHAANAETGAA